MSNPRVFITKRQPVIVGHVCSSCGNPVISAVLVIAEAQKVVNFSHSKAERIADETATQAIQREIERIRSCKRNHCILGNNPNAKVSMLEVGLFCGSSISSINVPCPNCKHVEPWQRQIASSEQMNRLTADNFPIAFADSEESQKWALSIITDKIIAIEDRRNNPLNVQQAKEEALSLYATILVLSKQKESLPELSQKEDLLKAQASALKEKGELGFGEFKAKKELSARNKVINYRIDEINSIIQNKQKQFEAQILSSKTQLQDIQPIAYGCTGKAKIVELLKAFCFIVEANEIPADVIAQIEQKPKYVI